MSNKNLFEKLNLTGAKSTSALELLKEQARNFKVSTEILEMNIVVNSGYFENNLEKALTFAVYINAPEVGNYRRKILTVAEFESRGEFPVDIVNHLEG